MLPKSNTFWGVIYFLVIAIFISTISLIGILLSSYLLTEKIEDIKDNFERKPLFDFHRATNGECDAGYEPITIDEWMGTVKGCKCKTTISKKACNKKNNQHTSCHSVSQLKAIEIQKWRNTMLCTKTLDNSYLYYPLLMNSVEKGKEC